MQKFLSLVLIVCLLLVSGSSWAQSGAMPLIPIRIQQGMGLIRIARRYCRNQNDWQTIARINHLRSPYRIQQGAILLVPLNLLAKQDIVVRVQTVHGKAELLLPHHGAVPLKKGDTILPGQTIRTGAAGHVTLQYPGKISSQIGPLSEVTLIYLFRLRDKAIKAELSLKHGKIIHTIDRKLAPNETFRTVTPIAVTGIRGTRFRLKATGSEISMVETLRGKVDFVAQGNTLLVAQDMGSRVKKGHPPEPPRRLPPPPSVPALVDTFRRLPVNIALPAAKGAVSFRLFLSRDRQGRDIVFEKRCQPERLCSLDRLADGSYWGHLTALDKDNFESRPSAPFPIKVRTSPGPVAFQTPAPPPRSWEKRMTFRWKVVPGAAHYQLELATDREFHTLILQQALATTTFTTPELEPGEYFLRVCSVAPDNFSSLFSPVQHWQVLRMPMLKEVELNKHKHQKTVSWKKQPGISCYALQVCGDAACSTILQTHTGLKTTSTVLDELETGTYYVRLRGTTASGVNSPWTTPQSFTVDPQPLGLPHLLVALGFLALVFL